jgi:hypothetical protein
MVRPPDLIAHADWSLSPRHRRMTVAVRVPSRSRKPRYRLRPPGPVGEPSTLLARLRARAGKRAAVLVGFDFPIGLPRAYAERVGVTDFPALLAALGRQEDQWADFLRVAERPEDISLRRPFYPRHRGRTAELLSALGLKRFDDLRRACDLGHEGRRPAAALFWTFGQQQCGKSAIAGWRDVLIPALTQPDPAARPRLWPYDGTLADLLRPGSTVIAEAYPAEFYGPLGVRFGRAAAPAAVPFGKPVREARAANGPAILRFAESVGAAVSQRLARAIRTGFGDAADAEDRFDCLVGALGMLAAATGRGRFAEPTDPAVRRVEGWIFGQPPRP